MEVMGSPWTEQKSIGESGGSCYFQSTWVEDGFELPRHLASVLTGETWATPAFTLGVQNLLLERAGL